MDIGYSGNCFGKRGRRFLKGWSYHKVEQHAKWVDGKIRSLSTSSLSKVKPANKLIPDIDEAAGYIQNLKDKGFRVGIAMGAFDLFHEGHLEFLKEAKELLGKYGKLGVVIPSDNLVGYAKGPERPVKILEKRTGSVSELASVDFTVPATYPQELSLTRELVEAYYLSLHQKLSPHFRLIGEQKDPNFDLYANQCLEAGIILLYKGEENVYSTTRQIEDILEKFSKT